MWGWFKKKRAEQAVEQVSVWKNDFSDCVAADYLPGYSVCQSENNMTCRYVTRYAGMTLCSNPDHKAFIPVGSEPFNPRRHI